MPRSVKLRGFGEIVALQMAFWACFGLFQGQNHNFGKKVLKLMVNSGPTHKKAHYNNSDV